MPGCLMWLAEPDQRCIRGKVGLAPINALPSPTAQKADAVQ
jgi:hypothetical protein